MAKTEITPENYRSRYQPQAQEQFRNAVRLAREAFRSPEAVHAWRQRAFDLVATSLVEYADLSGFTLDVDPPVTTFEKEFDYGAQLGIGGSVVGRFTATPEQMIRWLTVEHEKKDARLRALESWWPFRVRRVVRAAIAGWQLR